MNERNQSPPGLFLFRGFNIFLFTHPYHLSSDHQRLCSCAFETLCGDVTRGMKPIPSKRTQNRNRQEPNSQGLLTNDILN